MCLIFTGVEFISVSNDALRELNEPLTPNTKDKTDE